MSKEKVYLLKKNGKRTKNQSKKRINLIANYHPSLCVFFFLNNPKLYK